MHPKSEPVAPPAWPWVVRKGLWLALAAPLFPHVIGSAFNIWYNQTQSVQLLDDGQKLVFERIVMLFNAVVYPAAVAVWCWLVLSLRRPFEALLRGQAVPRVPLSRARRRVINLPWWGALVAVVAWGLCIPAFLLPLAATRTPLDPQVYLHFPAAFLISAFIASTQSVFLVELVSQRLLYPVFFRDAQPSRFPGGMALTLRGRGLLWWIASNVCPIVSLLLLQIAGAGTGTEGESGPDPQVAVVVGLIWIGFGLLTALLLSDLVIRPVAELRRVAQAVTQNQLDGQIAMRRADEFGELLSDIDQMREGLRERERIRAERDHVRQTFGMHVGHDVAQQILELDPDRFGIEAVVTVMFVDIRDYTARGARLAPFQVVSLLNEFLAVMVPVIEDHGGLVNKFLGDGFMALFGHTGRPEHAEAAVAAARQLLDDLDELNSRLRARGEHPLQIGIGIHTGPAIVGNIGAPKRQEFTAIGDAVNVASRVEGLTKVVREPVLLTTATCAAMLHQADGIEELRPQRVKGQPEPLRICRLTRAGRRRVVLAPLSPADR